MATPGPMAIGGEALRYEARAGDPERERELVLQVWHEGGFAGSVAGDAARYDWFYLQNPEGQAQLNLLGCSSAPAPIGSLGVGPRRYHVAGEDVLGGMLVDFVVHPQHRTALPALALQRFGRERAMQTMELLYGLPDTKAVMIFKRLGGQVRFDLPSYSRVVCALAYLRRHMPAVLAAPLSILVDMLDSLGTRLRLLFGRNIGHWVEEFDERFDRLWSAFDKTNRCIGVRDSAFLRWRFGRQPGHAYRTFVVKRRGSDELCMYFVCEFSKTALTVKDCLCMGTQAEVTQALLMLTMVARAARLNVVHIQIASADRFRRALLGAQFVQRSQRPFFAVLSEPLAARGGGKGWYITQADEDI